MSFFSSFYDFYNSLGLVIVICAFAFTFYLKIKNDNLPENKKSKNNYTALLAIEAVFGLFILYNLSNLNSKRKNTLGMIELFSLA